MGAGYAGTEIRQVRKFKSDWNRREVISSCIISEYAFLSDWK